MKRHSGKGSAYSHSFYKRDAGTYAAQVDSEIFLGHYLQSIKHEDQRVLFFRLELGIQTPQNLSYLMSAQ